MRIQSLKKDHFDDYTCEIVKTTYFLRFHFLLTKNLISRKIRKTEYFVNFHTEMEAACNSIIQLRLCLWPRLIKKFLYDLLLQFAVLRKTSCLMQGHSVEIAEIFSHYFSFERNMYMKVMDHYFFFFKNS